MKPSERIEQIVRKLVSQYPNARQEQYPEFWIGGILQYLDEQAQQNDSANRASTETGKGEDGKDHAD